MFVMTHQYAGQVTAELTPPDYYIARLYISTKAQRVPSTKNIKGALNKLERDLLAMELGGKFIE